MLCVLTIVLQESTPIPPRQRTTTGRYPSSLFDSNSLAHRRDVRCLFLLDVPESEVVYYPPTSQWFWPSFHLLVFPQVQFSSSVYRTCRTLEGGRNRGRGSGRRLSVIFTVNACAEGYLRRHAVLDRFQGVKTPSYHMTLVPWPRDLTRW